MFAAASAVFVKTPAEKSLQCHVQFLRELLDHGVLAAIVWLDTRDMCSDGLTDPLSDDDLAEICRSHDPEDLAEILVQQAIANGTEDNVTVVVVTIQP